MASPEVISESRIRKRATLKLYADLTANIKPHQEKEQMRLTIKKMTLSNFKGIRQQEFDFRKVNEISGQNGSGKTTIGVAFYWLFADVDMELKSNPNVFNVDGSEASPKVEIIADIDGREVAISRTVKRTIKASKQEGLGDSVTFSSTYTVNAVEYGLRDFKKKLEEYGITDKFITLSHPDSFLSEKKDEIRKTLFGMVSSITDLDIAKGMSGVDEATKLLETYTFEEVSAMQNASLRKIREVYGKDGELLRAKIEGLELSKVDDDFAEVELQKNLLTEKLEQCKAAIHAGELLESELNNLRSENMKIQFEISGIKNKMQAEKQAKENKLLANRREIEEKAKQLDRDITRMTSEVSVYETSFQNNERERKRLESLLKETQKTTFNNASLICPTCGQLYQFDKQEELKANFEKDKANKILHFETLIKETKSLLAIKHAESDEIDRKIKKAMVDRTELEIILNQPLNALQGNMDEPTVYDEQLASLEAELKKSDELMGTKKASIPNMTMLKAQEVDLNGKIRDCEIQLSRASLNDQIDGKIEELQRQQIEFEQAKANCERVLYQLSLIQKRKNETLSDKINEHFKLVKWILWDYQKNGDIKDVVIPTVNGKMLGVSLNTALCVMAKLDIVQGLQTFYNEFYPVFLDQSEALDSNSKALINMPCQLTYLTVTNDKELTIKEV